MLGLLNSMALCDDICAINFIFSVFLKKSWLLYLLTKIVTNPKLCGIFATVGEQCQRTLLSLSLTGIYLARCLPVFQSLPKVEIDLKKAYFI